MEHPSFILLPAGSPIPCQYSASRELDIPAISRGDVAGVTTEAIDITTCGSGYREFMPGPVTVRLRDGRTFTGDPVFFAKSFSGGGRFIEAILNPVEGPITEAQWEAENEPDYPDWD